MTKEKVVKMSIETYRRKRHRLHLRDPNKYSELTSRECMIIKAALSQNLGEKYHIHLSYMYDQEGKLMEIFVLK